MEKLPSGCSSPSSFATGIASIPVVRAAKGQEPRVHLWQDCCAERAVHLQHRQDASGP